jgi:hypothetical protein
MRGHAASTENRAGVVLIVASALVLVVASVAVTAVMGLSGAKIAVAFGAFIAIGELISINLPGYRIAAPLAVAGALGYALLERFQGDPVSFGVAQVVTVVAVGTVVGAIPNLTLGRQPQLDVLARRLLTVAFAAALFRPMYNAGWLDGLAGWQLPALMLAIVALAGSADVVLAAVVRSSQRRSPYLSTLRDEGRAYIGIGAAIGATGVLIALATDVMGYWALPVFAIPLLIAQFSFRRYAAIRATYSQTIHALSRVTEFGGYTERGHARRVNALALSVGREMGLSESELIDLEYAALMHDIGQLSLTDPIPGGATVMVSTAEQRRIAEYGAQVIRQTGVLDRVADIVEKQAEPFRVHGQPLDASVPVASRIIRAVNAYDDLVGDAFDIERQLSALEELRLVAGEAYDPKVVDVLSRIVERNSRLG